MASTKLARSYLAQRLLTEEIVVVSPDAGGMKRAERFRQSLSRVLARPIASAFMEKQRAGGLVSGEAVIGEVGGKVAIVIDDLISTGTTLARAAQACRVRGATNIFALATHGLFVKDADHVLSDPTLGRVIVTDSVEPFRLHAEIVQHKLVVLSIASLLAEAIKRIHTGGSIVELLQG